MRRRRYLKKLCQAIQGQTPGVFIDETGFESSTGREYAWAIPGKRVFGYVDGNRRKRTSLLGGYLNHRLIAPCLFSGHCNTMVFNAWLEQELLPRLSPGTILILDNVSFHKTQATAAIVERAKCRLLFLPPYSPHLNPIEKLWANLKRHWRNHAELSLEQLIASSQYLGN